MSKKTKETRKPGIYTKTNKGRLKSVRVACQANDDRLDIDDHLIICSTGSNEVTVRVSNYGADSVQVCIPRKRLLTLARLLRTMAKQLPKETEQW